MYKDIKTTLSDDKVPPAVADGVKKSEKKKGGSKKKKEEVTKLDTSGSGEDTSNPKSKPKREKKVTSTPETNPKGKEGDGAENSEKPKNPKSRKLPSIVTKGKEIFEEYYVAEFGSAYYWEAKDAVGMKKLLQKISYSREHRDIPLPIDEESVLDALQQFLQAIDKAWIRNNFSVPKINSFYNDIVSEIKNKKKNTNGTNGPTVLATRGNTTAKLVDTERKSTNIIADFAQAGTEWEAKKRDKRSRAIIDVEPLPG